MSTAPRTRGRKLVSAILRAEDALSVLLVSLMVILSLLTVVFRVLARPGIRGSADYIRHLVIWIAFVGGAITSRQGTHLSLTYGLDFFGAKAKAWIKLFTSLIDVMVLTALTVSSISFSLLAFEPGARAGVIPLWILSLIMPAGFLVMTATSISRSSDRALRRLIPALGILAGLALGLAPLANLLRTYAGSSRALAGLSSFLEASGETIAPLLDSLHLPLVIILIASTLLGTPVFVLLGGLALLLFFHAGGSLEVIPNEAYTMLSGPVIPALPLFTLAGFIISESKAGERLVKLFRSLFGWLPGGLAIMSVVICAFLTTFTGASGVTILIVGGLLFYILTAEGYGKSFSTGLLTASGSVGLLFPPSLPVILYGVVAQINIKELFVGGLLPGLFLILALSVLGIVAFLRAKPPRPRFRLSEALPALRDTAWEVALPLLILVLFLRGIMTLVETAAFSVLYAFVVEVVIHRDIRLRDVPGVFFKAAAIMGGVLVILAVAKGLSYYIVDAEIPTRLADWAQSVVHSRFVFLLLLNLALLIVGCFMDIFSAITVVAPLVIPLGAAYGVHPVHLGIIFLANLELGYLTPPVGINLFLASYRFEEPLGKIYGHVLPFLAALFAAVIVITYVPWLTTALIGVLRF